MSLVLDSRAKGEMSFTASLQAVSDRQSCREQPVAFAFNGETCREEWRVSLADNSRSRGIQLWLCLPRARKMKPKPWRRHSGASSKIEGCRTISYFRNPRSRRLSNVVSRRSRISSRLLSNSLATSSAFRETIRHSFFSIFFSMLGRDG